MSYIDSDLIDKENFNDKISFLRDQYTEGSKERLNNEIRNSLERGDRYTATQNANEFGICRFGLEQKSIYSKNQCPFYDRTTDTQEMNLREKYYKQLIKDKIDKTSPYCSRVLNCKLLTYGSSFLHIGNYHSKFSAQEVMNKICNDIINTFKDFKTKD